MRRRSLKGAGRGGCVCCLLVVSCVVEVCLVRERYDGKRRWVGMYVDFVCKNAVGLMSGVLFF